MVVSNEVKICCWGPLAFFGLVIFVPVFVIVPVQSIFFVAFIVIIYFLIKKNKSDKLAENLNKFDELDKKIKELLVGFAKRNYGVILNVTKLVNFGQKQTALELSEKEHFNENELNMLIQVLERKEFEVEKKELIYLIVSAFYYEFKGLIKKQYSGIKTAEKIVDRFFEEYEDQSLSNTEFLWLILDVKGFETDQCHRNPPLQQPGYHRGSGNFGKGII